MFARLAYAYLGVEAPTGDLYAIPGMEDYRSGVKLAFNVLLFDGKGQRKKWPEVMGIGLGNHADARAIQAQEQPNAMARIPAEVDCGCERTRAERENWTDRPHMEGEVLRYQGLEQWQLRQQWIKRRPRPRRS
jgi:hypothetical protein